MKRLTKQRHDVMQILYMLSGRTHPTIADRFMYNSPPKKVWCQIPFVLLDYGYCMCDEYERRTGKPDPIRERLDNRRDYFASTGINEHPATPNFLTSEAMQKSHRAILARQDEQHYAKYGFLRCPDDEKVFYWPVDEAQAQYDPRAIDEERRRERDRRRRDEEREREEREDRERNYGDDDTANDPFDDMLNTPQCDTCDCEACRRERELREHLNRPSYPVSIPVSQPAEFLTPAWRHEPLPEPTPEPAQPEAYIPNAWANAAREYLQAVPDNTDWGALERALVRQPTFQIMPEPAAEPAEDRAYNPPVRNYYPVRNTWGEWRDNER